VQTIQDAVPKLSLAALRKQARQRFQQAYRAEREFARQLTAVGKQVGMLVRGFAPEGGLNDAAALVTALKRYAEQIRPWATAVTQHMQYVVGKKDAKAWFALGRSMGQSIRKEIEETPTGEMLRRTLREQVDLITSLPVEAAERVQKLTVRGIMEATRAKEVEADILRTGDVTVARARTIARTEVARTASLLTQARAEYIGSPGYIWRTSTDGEVRPWHKKLEGTVVRWDRPPVVAADGHRAHAGQDVNCRCWPEPIIPDDLEVM
jgi:SPP1 gp7 family putative phage head morphogenesis protein